MHVWEKVVYKVSVIMDLTKFAKLKGFKTPNMSK